MDIYRLYFPAKSTVFVAFSSRSLPKSLSETALAVKKIKKSIKHLSICYLQLTSKSCHQALSAATKSFKRNTIFLILHEAHRVRNTEVSVVGLFNFSKPKYLKSLGAISTRLKYAMERVIPTFSDRNIFILKINSLALPERNKINVRPSFNSKRTTHDF